MSWCSDAPEDEAISLFAGLLANPDVRLSQTPLSTWKAELFEQRRLRLKGPGTCRGKKKAFFQKWGNRKTVG